MSTIYSSNDINSYMGIIIAITNEENCMIYLAYYVLDGTCMVRWDSNVKKCAIAQLYLVCSVFVLACPYYFKLNTTINCTSYLQGYKNKLVMHYK